MQDSGEIHGNIGVIFHHVHVISYKVYCLPASGEFCHLLITYANSLDLDQGPQNISPDLDPNCATL